MTPTITARKTHEEDRGATAAALLSWYDRHHRRLPWRLPPREVRNGASPDPYRVWLSEIMLQQTTVSAVKPYFERFMARWPTVEALANADTDDVMKAWAGLGYYSRARNLKKCAETVMDRHGGAFPDTEEELKRLPGIGDYTAAAIAAISFGRPAAVVDGNVERVIARLHAIETPLPAAKAEIRHIVQRLVPEDRPGDFAQAMMDLGATICTARKPKCLLCPLSSRCAARGQGRQAELPVKAPKKVKPMREGTAFWIEREGKVWLVRRPAKGMLGGMRALPDDGWSARADGSGDAPLPGAWRAGGVVRHSFTHFDLELGLAIYAGERAVKVEGGDWWPVAEIAAAGLPTLFTKAARLALEGREGPSSNSD